MYTITSGGKSLAGAPWVTATTDSTLSNLMHLPRYPAGCLLYAKRSLPPRNIMPVREVLRNKSVKKTNSKRNGWAAWRASPGSVHVAGSGTSSFLEISKNAPSTVSALDGIIAFPTLRQAFEEFCRRALCSEVSCMRGFTRQASNDAGRALGRVLR